MRVSWNSFGIPCQHSRLSLLLFLILGLCLVLGTWPCLSWMNIEQILGILFPWRGPVELSKTLRSWLFLPQAASGRHTWPPSALWNPILYEIFCTWTIPWGEEDIPIYNGYFVVVEFESRLTFSIIANPFWIYVIPLSRFPLYCLCCLWPHIARQCSELRKQVR